MNYSSKNLMPLLIFSLFVCHTPTTSVGGAIGGAAAASRWVFTISNHTKFKAQVTVVYPGCANDHLVVYPTEIRSVNAHSCLIKRLEVAIVKEEGNPNKTIHFDWTVAGGHRDFSAAIVERNGNFTIDATYF